MLARDLVRRVRRIEISTRRAVQDALAGSYHSVFRGRGMEVAEIRAYQAGDDVRAIDWNATARLGHPFVKRFVEERELTVLVLCDLSASTAFGSGERAKGEVAAEIAALVAFSAVANGDRCGLALFTSEVERYVPPRKGKRHALRLVSEVLQHRPLHTGTDLAAALEFAARVQRRRAVVFVLSDFLGAPPSLWEKALRVAARRHDVIPVVLSDRSERELPAAGLAWIEDPETGEVFEADLSSAATRRRLAASAQAEAAERSRLFARLSLDAADLRADAADHVAPLLALFRARAGRRR
ncbi:MAG: DUF58 domain-containing protein [Deltaproteobacteria bacterium]|nr:DUF58 domain-containing protein [Deltaproteobacteria bacterium]